MLAFVTLALLGLTSALPTSDVTLEIPITVTTAIDAAILDDALRETSDIFAVGDIALRFSLVDSSRRHDGPVSVLLTPRPSRFVVHGCRRGRHDHRLGLSQLRTRRITLWTEQVARAVDGNWDRPDIADVHPKTYARALGRVLAHELGHLLLRLDRHRETGLMRSSFSHRSLIARGRRAFRLSEEDLAAIRAAIGRQPRRTPPSNR